MLDGVTELSHKKYFVLRVLQGRNPEWVGRLFFAEYDPEAAWLDELRPAFGEPEFFYADELAELRRRRARVRLSVIDGAHVGGA